MTRHPPRKPRPPTQDPPLVDAWREATYTWPCPTCPCTTNLRGLLRVHCAHCGHVHQPPPEEDPHA